MLPIDLLLQYQSAGPTKDLLNLTYLSWNDWQSNENQKARKAQPAVNEEYSTLVRILELELEGHIPRILSHQDFVASNPRCFSQIFIGNAGVIVVNVTTPKCNL